MREDQAGNAWLRHKEVASYRTLSSLSIGIVGLGDIGLEIARICKALGMATKGVTRTARPPEERKDFVDEYFTMAELPTLLRSSDYVCNVLPSTASTRGLLSGEMLRACSRDHGGKGAVFVNVGRGDVLSECSLIRALKSGWISGAILDVFETEPLPAGSELWGMKGVTISPHVSAVSFSEEVVEVMRRNYEKYVAQGRLDYVVDWRAEY